MRWRQAFCRDGQASARCGVTSRSPSNSRRSSPVTSEIIGRRPTEGAPRSRQYPQTTPEGQPPAYPASVSSSQVPDPTTEIFVKLLDEAVDVWRPVKAVHLDGQTYRIVEQPYDRETETWEFVPGTTVQFEVIDGSDGPITAAARAVDP